MITEQFKSIVDEVGDSIMAFEGKNILISGACGFLGSWLIATFQYLNQTQFRRRCIVHAIDSHITGNNINNIFDDEDDNVIFINDDISKMHIDQQFHYIIHAAGIASPVHYQKHPLETIDGMVGGCRNLLEVAKSYKVDSMLVFSSSEIYGNPVPDMIPTPETYNGNVSCIGPRSCYDESKRMVEAICQSYYNMYRIPVKWVRPFNIYGPGMNLNDGRVVPKFILAALTKQPLTVYLPATQTRTFCYIRDAIVGFLKTLLLGRNGEPYNIGYPNEEISALELAEKVSSLVNDVVKITKIPMPLDYPKDQVQRRCPSLIKAKEHLDYSPKIALNDGLKMTLEWFSKTLQYDVEGKQEHVSKQRGEDLCQAK